jgi:hypothetical protein
MKGSFNMLKGLRAEDWLSLLDIPKERTPIALVLRGTRNLKRQYRAYRKYFSTVLAKGAHNGILEDVFISGLNSHTVADASVYGAPMASENEGLCKTFREWCHIQKSSV